MPISEPQTQEDQILNNNKIIEVADNFQVRKVCLKDEQLRFNTLKLEEKISTIRKA